MAALLGNGSDGEWVIVDQRKTQRRARMHDAAWAGPILMAAAGRGSGI
jgi:hypothetical protein